MSFIVEDGTGVVDSTSYLSVARAEEILTDLGYEVFPTETDLINGSLYFDINLDPASFILTEDQGLLWPREKFTDNQGREVSGIPFAMERAVAVISAGFIEEDLFDSGPAVVSEDYGDSSVEFAGPTSSVPGNITKQISYLKALGYGSSSVATVRLIRGD